MRVGPADIADPQVVALIEAHQREMFAISPPGTSFALDVTGLQGPDISLFGAWDGATLIAIGALRHLSPGHAEIKSMRTHPAHLRRGAAQAVLAALLATGRATGVRRFSLETGTSKAFAPAVALYRRHGFRPGEAFAGYANGAHNQCYHRDDAPGPDPLAAPR